jgi:hypothetical protein
MPRRQAQILLLGLALAACSPEERADPLPPLDRFYFPTGVAVSAASGVTGGKALVVASSNFDLRYSATDGGTVLSVNPQTSAVDPLVTPGRAAVDLLDAERIASYSGAVAVADDANCPGLSSPLVLVASRFDDVLYRFGLGTSGALDCGAGCALGVGGAAKDPFGVTVACGPAGRRAYVGFLDTPKSTSGTGEGAWIAEVDLDGIAPMRSLDVGDGTVRSMAYEAEADRLWIAARSWGARALLYSVVLSSPTWKYLPSYAADSTDLYPSVRGLELRSLAVGTPIPGATSRRLYATGRLFDADNIASDGSHPAADVGGLLLVLDVTDGLDGRPVVQIRNTVSLGTNVGDVAVVWRKSATGTPLRDVVIATALDGDLLFVYDDEAEAIAEVIGHDPIGLPYLGDRPMALAVDQPRPDATSATYPATVYVGAFGGHRVDRFVLDPADLSLPLTLESIGGLAP